MKPSVSSHLLSAATYAGTVLGCAVLAHLLQWPAAATGLLCASLAMLPSALYRARLYARALQREKQTWDFIQRLLDVIPEPVYIKDAQGRYTIINRAFAQRRHQAPEDILGRTAAELAPNPATAQLAAEEDARVLAGTAVFKEDQTSDPTSGVVQYRVVTKGACLDPQGQPVIIGANFDITGMRVAQLQLRAALDEQKALTERTRTFIQQLLDVIPYPTYVRDEHSRFQIVNNAFLCERGLTREAVLGRTPLDLAPGTAHGRRSVEEDRSVLAGAPLKKEEGGQHPTSGDLYFQVVIKGCCPDTEGKPVVVGINIDITDLRNSELQVQSTLEQLRLHHQHTLDFVQRVLDLLPFPVYVKDAQSRYLMVNEAMARDQFVRRDQLLRNMGLPLNVSAERMRELFEEDGRVLAGVHVLREDQGAHPVTGRETFRIISKGACNNALNEPVIVGAIVDLTDLRLAERELKTAYDREVTLRERTLEFVQRLIDVIPDPVYVKHEDGHYAMVNNAFADYHRMSKDALITTPPEQLRLGSDKAKKASMQEDLAVLAGEEVLKEEHITRKATGEEVFRIVCKRCSVYFDGSPVIIGIDHHITQWRLAERELQRLAQEDALTGLSNRRHFQNKAAQALARASRYHERLSLLMLDIDYFKRVNDTWGHQVGDEVLVETVQRMRFSLRNTDLPARWGGEEFIVLLPHTGATEAMLVAERLRQHLAEYPIATMRGPVPVTLSVGMAQWRPKEALDRLILRADEALYRAKASGRNQVVMADDLQEVTPPPPPTPDPAPAEAQPESSQ